MSTSATTLSARPRLPGPLRLLLPVLATLAFAQAATASQGAGAGNDAAMKAALAAAQRGQLAPGQAEALRGDPRLPWLEYAQLSRDLDGADPARVRAFLQRYDGQAAAAALRPLWLGSLARRQQWDAFLVDWRPSEDAALRCARLNAQQALGRADASWNAEAQALWRSG